MKTLLLFLFVFLNLEVDTSQSSPEIKGPIIVAMIDTGFDFKSSWEEHLSKVDTDGYRIRQPKACKQGHKDFTGDGLEDKNGHGTHVAGIIAKFAEDADYCLVILKYVAGKQENNMKTSIAAIQRAIDLKVHIINYSGGGVVKNEIECVLIKQAIDMGIAVVAAAGNEGKDVNVRPFYPAMCDNRVIAVRNTDDIGNIAGQSNFTNKKKNSRELVEEKGVNVLSTLPNNEIGVMTGTSQSVPTYVGKLINKIKNKKSIKAWYN